MRRSLALVFMVAAAAHAGDEIELKNDSLVDGGTAAIQIGFVDGEIGAATFYPPAELFPLQVKRVQFFWASATGGQPDSLQESIQIWDKGLPNPGIPIFEADGPQMVDGFLNEFDLELFEIIIVEPGPITVGLQFADAPNGNPLKPSLVTDIDGCQPGHNPINAIPGGWTDLCAFGVSGDLVIRAIVEPTEAPCVADFNDDGVLNVLDFVAFQQAFVAGDPKADVNGDGNLNIIDFATFQVLWQEGCP